MAAAAQLLADGAGLPLQFRCQSVQQCRLTHARVAAESTEMIFDLRLDLVKALAGLVVQLHQRDATSFVGMHQRIRRAKVSLGHDQNRLYIFINGSRCQLVQHQGTGHRLHGACHNEQHIQICNRRAHKHVFARPDLVDDRAVRGKLYPIACHRLDAAFTEDAARLAFFNAIRRFYVVKSADAFCDIVHSVPHQSGLPWASQRWPFSFHMEPSVNW